MALKAGYLRSRLATKLSFESLLKENRRHMSFVGVLASSGNRTVWKQSVKAETSTNHLNWAGAALSSPRLAAGFGVHQRRWLSSGDASGHHKRWTDLDIEDVRALIDSGDICLIDVREPEEIKDKGAIPDSVNIPLGQLRDAFMLPADVFENRYKFAKPKQYDANIVFYGQSSFREPIKSTAAVELAHKLGFTKARHYVGGYEEWSEKNPA